MGCRVSRSQASTLWFGGPGDLHRGRAADKYDRVMLSRQHRSKSEEYFQQPVEAVQ